MTYEELKRVNEEMTLLPLKGKDYAEVNQRILAFRKLYPNGFIRTEILRLEDGVCVIRAEAGENTPEGIVILGTGTAYEKEGSSFVNETSYIENAETSAVGRALGMLGLGIGTSVASAEEVQNATLNQKSEPKKSEGWYLKASEKQVATLRSHYKGENLKKLLEKNGIERLEDLPMAKATELIGYFIQKNGG